MGSNLCIPFRALSCPSITIPYAVNVLQLFTAFRPFGPLAGARLLKRSAVVHITADHYTNFEESWKTSSLFIFGLLTLFL